MDKDEMREWIAQQRENLTKYKKTDGSIKVAAERQYIIDMHYPAALDALFSTLADPNSKDWAAAERRIEADWSNSGSPALRC